MTSPLPLGCDYFSPTPPPLQRYLFVQLFCQWLITQIFTQIKCNKNIFQVVHLLCLNHMQLTKRFDGVPT